VVWRRVARTARPLPGRTLPPEPAPETPLPAPAPQPAAPARTSTPAPAARRPAPPAELSGERRIRRGRLEVDGTLDLHGMTLPQARAALSRFLAFARAEGARVVIVVTGKGRAGEGVLRREVPEWLKEESLHVTGYAPAHQRHGGSGALYVRLRRTDQGA